MVKVSVIIPVYQVERTLDRCIESVRNQSLKEIEIILVDDGSPDKCPQICDEYAQKDERIKVIHKANGGLGYARNSGLDIAVGEYVAFLDSDDYVSEEMYFDMYSAAKLYSADAVYGGISYIRNGKVIRSEFEREIRVYSGAQEVKEFIFHHFTAQPSDAFDSKYGATCTNGILSLSIINSKNIRFKSERDFISEDSVFDVDFLTEINKAVMLPKHYYCYDYNPDSLTSSYRPDRFEKNKVLYNYVVKAIEEKYNDDNFVYLYARYFLQASRVCIIQEALNGSGIKGIRQINNDEFYRSILDSYPWRKLPLKKRIFAFLSVIKCNLGQYILVKIAYRVK